MYKTILILGAETHFGKHLTDYLLSQNYFVTIFIYNKKANNIQNFNLEIIEGDIFDYEVLRYAVAGQQVVINVLDYKNYKFGAISVISQNIVHAVNSNYVDKYIGLAPFGSGQTKDKINLIYKLLNYLKFIKPTLNEYSFQESLLAKCKFDYTIIQVGKIINEAKTTCNIKIIKPIELKKAIHVNEFTITENTLSQAFQSIMNLKEYNRTSVILSNTKL
jgi:putative NADH-flavin reductase